MYTYRISCQILTIIFSARAESGNLLKTTKSKFCNKVYSSFDMPCDAYLGTHLHFVYIAALMGNAHYDAIAGDPYTAEEDAILIDYYKANSTDLISLNEHKFYEGMAERFVCVSM